MKNKTNRYQAAFDECEKNDEILSTSSKQKIRKSNIYIVNSNTSPIIELCKKISCVMFNFLVGVSLLFSSFLRIFFGAPALFVQLHPSEFISSAVLWLSTDCEQVKKNWS